MTMTLESLKGRIGDLDSHENIPVPRYPRIFGEVGQRFIDENKEMWQRAEQIALATMDKDPGALITVDREDNEEITQEAVWEKKGVMAPGAIDMDRRTAVMDAMGIQRQLIFPMMGIFGWIQAMGGGQGWMPVATREQIALGREAVRAYNKWAGQLTKKYPDRMWMVGMLLSGEVGLTPEAMAERAEELIEGGVKAIMISGGEPPAGLSPADRRLDPFYATLARKNVTLTFHPPSSLGFRRSEVWEAALLDPSWGFVTNIHAPHENFLAMMVLGGVLERHPNLRVAFVETGAHWIAPLAEHMDYVVSSMMVGSSPLSMKPSEYVARNVRTSVLRDEPVEKWLERYPHLQSIYCYSSDFPHPEGKSYSLKVFYDRIAPLGDDVVEKFFVTNSQLILPALA